MKRTGPQLVALLLLGGGAHAGGSPSSGYSVFNDPAGDAVIRRTDLGNDAPLPPGYEPIDLLQLRLEGWETSTPQSDPYTGTTTGGDADLVRVQIILDGLVCPPGPLGIDQQGSAFDPYRYGDRPLFGYIEIDIDDQKNTGGEFTPLANNRYLANVGRFGLSPQGSLSERMVRNAGDFDTIFSTEPQFERTGGEFAITLCGCFTPTIVSQSGDMDSIFDPGETWVVRGRFFQRFIAFQAMSDLFGGFEDGLFEPPVDLRFEHDTHSDQTTVTMIFPITNTGSAQLRGEAVQGIDLNTANQTSIFEALDDLIYNSEYATGDLRDMVDNWRGRDLEDYQRPRDWFAHAIVGTSPTVKDPAALFVWTDTGFNEVLGDFNDDDTSDSLDTQILQNTITTLDGTTGDSDGVVNGEVGIAQFARSFNLLDLNYDGVISESDLGSPPCPADLTGDGLLNFFDISAFLGAFSAHDPSADFTGDGQFNFFDVSAFLSAFSAGCP